MHWTDIDDIALALEEKYPKQDIVNINFMILQKLVYSLPEFNDPTRSNEHILEAIQSAWLKEREYVREE